MQPGKRLIYSQKKENSDESQIAQILVPLSVRDFKSENKNEPNIHETSEVINVSKQNLETELEISSNKSQIKVSDSKSENEQRSTGITSCEANVSVSRIVPDSNSESQPGNIGIVAQNIQTPVSSTSNSKPEAELEDNSKHLIQNMGNSSLFIVFNTPIELKSTQPSLPVFPGELQTECESQDTEVKCMLPDASDSKIENGQMKTRISELSNASHLEIENEEKNNEVPVVCITKTDTKTESQKAELLLKTWCKLCKYVYLIYFYLMFSIIVCYHKLITRLFLH